VQPDSIHRVLVRSFRLGRGPTPSSTPLSSDVRAARTSAQAREMFSIRAPVHRSSAPVCNAGKHTASLSLASRENCRPLSSSPMLQVPDDTLRHSREGRSLSLSLSLSLSFSLSLCVVAVLSFLEEGRPLSSTTSTTTTTTAMTATTVITTFSLRQLQLEWHRKRQLVSCVRSSAHL